uniref:Adhesion G protein-coupled receptor V1 n=1 Tax=Laticauda laticaudata TaxID=8630 RepID=A0A8C5RCP3_LATLA
MGCLSSKLNPFLSVEWNLKMEEESSHFRSTDVLYTTLEFIVRYHGALSQVTLYWFIMPNDTEDVTVTSGNITFHTEQRKANLTVNILPDEIPELDKTLSVYIINVTHGRLGVHTNATLTILANDDPYGLLIFSGKNRPIKVEEETKNVTLTIVRLKGHLGVVKVTYRTMYDEDVSFYLPSNIARATLGEDYLPISGFVILPANETINIFDDTVPEEEESFRVWLKNPKGGAEIGSNGYVTIVIPSNDDAHGVVAFAQTVAAYEIPPPDNILKLSIVRKAGTFGSIKLDWEATPASASPKDFSPSFGNLIFADGQVCSILIKHLLPYFYHLILMTTITIIDDEEVEFLEMFTITLLRVTGDARLGDDVQMMVTIAPNDSPAGVFSFEEKHVSESKIVYILPDTL